MAVRFFFKIDYGPRIKTQTPGTTVSRRPRIACGAPVSPLIIYLWPLSTVLLTPAFPSTFIPIVYPISPRLSRAVSRSQSTTHLPRASPLCPPTVMTNIHSRFCTISIFFLFIRRPERTPADCGCPTQDIPRNYCSPDAYTNNIIFNNTDRMGAGPRFRSREKRLRNGDGPCRLFTGVFPSSVYVAYVCAVESVHGIFIIRTTYRTRSLYA